MEYAIDMRGVSKKYQGFALDHVDFKLPKGRVIGLIGENGAGKTTLIKAALGLVCADEGEIFLLGNRINEDVVEYKEEIGVVFDSNSFPEDFKIHNIRKIMSSIYNTWDDAEFDRLIQRFKLPTGKKIKEFSRGMKMKLNIAVALSHNAKLLILDEATGGLDPVVRDEILELFLEFMQDEEHAVLISSHITSDIEKIADSIAFIKNGRIVFCENKDDLKYEYGILKCRERDLDSLNKDCFVAERKNSFQHEVLIRNKSEFMKKYPDVVVDPASVEDIMLFYAKGELL